jgi:sulfonate transport system substrate-binding protein
VRSRVLTGRFAGLTAILALAVAAVGACSSSASTRSASDSGTTTKQTPVALRSAIPSGTTLRVGDQLDYLKTVLKLSGQDKGFPYRVDYSAFIGGPPMLQAFQAGALDTGFVGSTPLIFAQAGHQDLVAVAGWAFKQGAYQLLTAPGRSDITGWASLKGKKVAYQQGTAGEAALLQALDGAGLKLSDVTTVNVPTTQITAALQGGSADAGLSVEPLTSVYLTSNPTAKVVAGTSAITDRSNFVLASQSALKDAGKTAALADYVTRLVKSFAYLRAHPDQFAQAVYVKQYHLTPARATEVLKQTGVASFVQLPGEVVSGQQRLADLFVAAGEIPSKVDAAAEFDTRFNAVVAKAQGQ